MTSTTEKIKQLESQMEGLILIVKEAEEERRKAVEDMDRDRRKWEELEKRLQETQVAAGIPYGHVIRILKRP